MYPRETEALAPIVYHSLSSVTGNLTNNVIHLSEMIDAIHNKLHPVLLPPNPMPSPTEYEYSEQAPAVRELLILNDKVAYLKEEVNDLLCRLNSI